MMANDLSYAQPRPASARWIRFLVSLGCLHILLPALVRAEPPEPVVNLKLTYPQIMSFEGGSWYWWDRGEPGARHGWGHFISFEPGIFGTKVKAGAGTLTARTTGYMGLRGGPTYLWMYRGLGSFDKGHYVGAEVTGTRSWFTLSAGFTGDVRDYRPLITGGIGFGW